MANNSIGAYAQGGSNEIGAYEKAAVAASNAISIIYYYYLVLMGGARHDV